MTLLAPDLQNFIQAATKAAARLVLSVPRYFSPSELTAHVGNQVSTGPGNWTVAINLSGGGPYVFKGILAKGVTVGIRITVDSNPTETFNAASTGDDAAGNLFDVAFLPGDIYAATSLLVEVQNGSGVTRDVGWEGYTTAP